MRKDYDYIIVGAGLCGLVLAKELVSRGKNILILEKGDFINKLGTVFNAFFFYEKHALSYSRQKVLIYRVNGVGGTSIVSCGNAVCPSIDEIKKTGIDFSAEIREARKESFVRDEGLTIGPASSRIMNEANKLGYDMVPMPKFSITGKCVSCGACALGCDYEAKWTSRYCLKGLNDEKYELVTRAKVEKVLVKGGRAVGVRAKKGLGAFDAYASKIILCAGGINTSIILRNSGVEAGKNLFVDLFNVTYGFSREYNQLNELSMAAVCAKFHQTDGFVLSPFVDNWFSFLATCGTDNLARVFSLRNLMGIMTKISDDNKGSVGRNGPPDSKNEGNGPLRLEGNGPPDFGGNGHIDKAPTDNDLKKLRKGSDMAKEILIKSGCSPDSIFVTRPSGAHPGGTAAIGSVVDKNLETKIKGLYVCDASVLPFAPGLPPILMLIALAKWFGKKV